MSSGGFRDRGFGPQGRFEGSPNSGDGSRIRGFNRSFNPSRRNDRTPVDVWASPQPFYQQNQPNQHNQQNQHHQQHQQQQQHNSPQSWQPRGRFQGNVRQPFRAQSFSRYTRGSFRGSSNFRSPNGRGGPIHNQNQDNRWRFVPRDLPPPLDKPEDPCPPLPGSEEERRQKITSAVDELKRNLLSNEGPATDDSSLWDDDFNIPGPEPDDETFLKGLPELKHGPPEITLTTSDLKDIGRVDVDTGQKSLDDPDCEIIDIAKSVRTFSEITIHDGDGELGDVNAEPQINVRPVENEDLTTEEFMNKPSTNFQEVADEPAGEVVEESLGSPEIQKESPLDDLRIASPGPQDIPKGCPDRGSPKDGSMETEPYVGTIEVQITDPKSMQPSNIEETRAKSPLLAEKIPAHIFEPPRRREPSPDDFLDQEITKKSLIREKPREMKIAKPRDWSSDGTKNVSSVLPDSPAPVRNSFTNMNFPQKITTSLPPPSTSFTPPLPHRGTQDHEILQPPAVFDPRKSSNVLPMPDYSPMCPSYNIPIMTPPPLNYPISSNYAPIHPMGSGFPPLNFPVLSPLDFPPPNTLNPSVNDVTQNINQIPIPSNTASAANEDDAFRELRRAMEFAEELMGMGENDIDFDKECENGFDNFPTLPDLPPPLPPLPVADIYKGSKAKKKKKKKKKSEREDSCDYVPAVVVNTPIATCETPPLPPETSALESTTLPPPVSQPQPQQIKEEAASPTKDDRPKVTFNLGPQAKKLSQSKEWRANILMDEEKRRIKSASQKSDGICKEKRGDKLQVSQNISGIGEGKKINSPLSRENVSTIAEVEEPERLSLHHQRIPGILDDDEPPPPLHQKNIVAVTKENEEGKSQIQHDIIPGICEGHRLKAALYRQNILGTSVDIVSSAPLDKKPKESLKSSKTLIPSAKQVERVEKNESHTKKSEKIVDVPVQESMKKVEVMDLLKMQVESSNQSPCNSSSTLRSRTSYTPEPKDLALKKPQEATWKDRVIGRFLRMSKNDIKNMINHSNLRKFDFAMQHLVKEKKTSLSLEMRTTEDERIKNRDYRDSNYDKEDFIHQLKQILDPAATVDISDLPTNFIHQLNEVLQLDVPSQEDTDYANASNQETIKTPSTPIDPHDSESSQTFEIQTPVITNSSTFTSSKIDKRGSRDIIKSESSESTVNANRSKRHHRNNNQEDNHTIHNSRLIAPHNSFNLHQAGGGDSLIMDELDDIFSAGMSRRIPKTPNQPIPSPVQNYLDYRNTYTVISRVETPIVDRVDRIFNSGLAKAKASAKADDRMIRSRKNSADLDFFRNLTREEYDARYGESSSSHDNPYRIMNPKLAKRLGDPVNQNGESEPDFKSTASRDGANSSEESTDYSSNSGFSSSSEEPSIDVSRMLRFIKEREKIAKKKSLNEEIRDEVTAEIERKRREKRAHREHREHRARTKGKSKKGKYRKERRHRSKKKKKRSRYSGDDSHSERSQLILTEREIKKEPEEEEEKREHTPQVQKKKVVGGKNSMDKATLQEENRKEDPKPGSSQLQLNRLTSAVKSSHISVNSRNDASSHESRNSKNCASTSHTPQSLKTKAQLKLMPEEVEKEKLSGMIPGFENLVVKREAEEQITLTPEVKSMTESPKKNTKPAASMAKCCKETQPEKVEPVVKPVEVAERALKIKANVLENNELPQGKDVDLPVRDNSCSTPRVEHNAELGEIGSTGCTIMAGLTAEALAEELKSGPGPRKFDIKAYKERALLRKLRAEGKIPPLPRKNPQTSNDGANDSLTTATVAPALVVAEAMPETAACIPEVNEKKNTTPPVITESTLGSANARIVPEPLSSDAGRMDTKTETNIVPPNTDTSPSKTSEKKRKRVSLKRSYNKFSFYFKLCKRVVSDGLPDVVPTENLFQRQIAESAMEETDVVEKISEKLHFFERPIIGDEESEFVPPVETKTASTSSQMSEQPQTMDLLIMDPLKLDKASVSEDLTPKNPGISPELTPKVFEVEEMTVSPDAQNPVSDVSSETLTLCKAHQDPSNQLETQVPTSADNISSSIPPTLPLESLKEPDLNEQNDLVSFRPDDVTWRIDPDPLEELNNSQNTPDPKDGFDSQRNWQLEAEISKEESRKNVVLHDRSLVVDTPRNSLLDDPIAFATSNNSPEDGEQFMLSENDIQGSIYEDQLAEGNIDLINDSSIPIRTSFTPEDEVRDFTRGIVDRELMEVGKNSPSRLPSMILQGMSKEEEEVRPEDAEHSLNMGSQQISHEPDISGESELERTVRGGLIEHLETLESVTEQPANSQLALESEMQLLAAGHIEHALNSLQAEIASAHESSTLDSAGDGKPDDVVTKVLEEAQDISTHEDTDLEVKDLVSSGPSITPSSNSPTLDSSKFEESRNPPTLEKSKDRYQKNYKDVDTLRKLNKSSIPTRDHKKHKHDKKKSQLTEAMVGETIKANIVIVEQPTTKIGVMARMREIDIAIQNLMNEKMTLYQMLQNDEWPIPETSTKEKTNTEKKLKKDVKVIVSKMNEETKQPQVPEGKPVSSQPITESPHPPKNPKSDDKRSTWEDKIPVTAKKRAHSKEKEYRRESSVESSHSKTEDLVSPPPKKERKSKNHEGSSKKPFKLSQLIGRDFKPKPSISKSKSSHTDKPRNSRSKNLDKPGKQRNNANNSLKSEGPEVHSKAEEKLKRKVQPPESLPLFSAEETTLDSSDRATSDPKKVTGLALLEESMKRETGTKKKGQKRLAVAEEIDLSKPSKKKDSQKKGTAKELTIPETLADTKIKNIPSVSKKRGSRRSQKLDKIHADESQERERPKKNKTKSNLIDSDTSDDLPSITSAISETTGKKHTEELSEEKEKKKLERQKSSIKDALLQDWSDSSDTSNTQKDRRHVKPILSDSEEEVKRILSSELPQKVRKNEGRTKPDKRSRSVMSDKLQKLQKEKNVKDLEKSKAPKDIEKPLKETNKNVEDLKEAEKAPTNIERPHQDAEQFDENPKVFEAIQEEPVQGIEQLHDKGVKDVEKIQETHLNATRKMEEKFVKDVEKGQEKSIKDIEKVPDKSFKDVETVQSDKESRIAGEGEESPIEGDDEDEEVPLRRKNLKESKKIGKRSNQSTFRSRSRPERAVQSSSREPSPEVNKVKKRPRSGSSASSKNGRRKSSSKEKVPRETRSEAQANRARKTIERNRDDMAKCSVRLVDCRYLMSMSPESNPQVFRKLAISKINSWGETVVLRQQRSRSRSEDECQDMIVVEVDNDDNVGSSSPVEMIEDAPEGEDTLSDKSVGLRFDELSGDRRREDESEGDVEMIEIKEEPISRAASRGDDVISDTGGESQKGGGEREENDEEADEGQKRESLRYTVHKGPILDIKVFGDSFLAASEDGAIYRYSQKSNGILNIYQGHEAAVTCLYVHEIPGITESKKWLLFSGSLDASLRCYDVTGGILNRPKVTVGSPIQCMDEAWGSIFIGTKSGHISRYDIKTGSLREDKLDFSDKPVLALRASTEGPRKILIVAARNQPITIRDAQSGLFLRTIAGPRTHTVYSLMRDRNYVYCGTSSTSIPVFDFISGEQITQYTAGVGIVCMRLYKQLLFAGCYDGNIYVFDTKEPKLICSIPGPGNMLLSMEVVEDTIIAGSKDRRLHAWRMPPVVRTVLLDRT